MEEEQTYTAFAEQRLVARGPLSALLPQAKVWAEEHPGVMLLIFEDRTCKQVDFDLRGSDKEVLDRATGAHPAGPGRPKLGVVAREVTLLPRHWEWLEQQPSGASAALRRLVDQARKQSPDPRLAMDATCRFLTAMAGDLPGYEEATRAIYAGNRTAFESFSEAWPPDIRAHAKTLAEGAFVSG